MTNRPHYDEDVATRERGRDTIDDPVASGRVPGRDPMLDDPIAGTPSTGRGSGTSWLIWTVGLAVVLALAIVALLSVGDYWFWG